jgi:hypothetical protein
MPGLCLRLRPREVRRTKPEGQGLGLIHVQLDDPGAGGAKRIVILAAVTEASTVYLLSPENQRGERDEGSMALDAPARCNPVTRAER